VGDVGDQVFLGGQGLDEARDVAVDDDGAAEAAVVVLDDPRRCRNGALVGCLADPDEVVRESFPRHRPVNRPFVLGQGRHPVLAVHELLRLLGRRAGAGGGCGLLENGLLPVDQGGPAVCVDGDNSDVDSVQHGLEQAFAFPAFDQQFAQFFVLLLQPLALDADVGAGKPDRQRNGEHH
jgi:hypothetical protein